MLWLVSGPEYGTKIDIGLDDGTGPMEYGCDVVTVEADTKADARVLGMKALRAQPYLQRYCDENPFAGVQVVAYEPEPDTDEDEPGDQ